MGGVYKQLNTNSWGTKQLRYYRCTTKQLKLYSKPNLPSWTEFSLHYKNQYHVLLHNCVMCRFFLVLQNQCASAYFDTPARNPKKKKVFIFFSFPLQDLPHMHWFFILLNPSLTLLQKQITPHKSWIPFLSPFSSWSSPSSFSLWEEENHRKGFLRAHWDYP